MAERSKLPPFGNWENGENVPYTAYFDDARKDKKGGKMNPNDPQDNRDMFSGNTTPVQAPPFHQEVELKGHKGAEAVRPNHEHRTGREDGDRRKLTDSPLHHDTAGVKSGSSKSESEAPKGQDALRPRHERQLSREEGDMRRSTDSPVHYENAGRRAAVDSPLHRGGMIGGDTPKRGTRQIVESDRSFEHSPLHQHYQARVGGRGSAGSSPSWERKGSSDGSHGLPPSTPGRSRLRSVTRGDETSDHSPAVPKFGDWDESDPASAEGYTHIFDKVREEKQTGASKVPIMPTESSHSTDQKQYGSDDSKGCGCFPWSRK